MGRKEKATSETRKIRVLDEAYQDIDNITDFIANYNNQPLNAVKVADAILETIDKIADNPFAYKECEQISTKTKMYRQIVCLSWLIIYKVTNAEILILGVIHASRKPSEITKLRKLK